MMRRAVLSSTRRLASSSRGGGGGATLLCASGSRMTIMATTTTSLAPALLLSSSCAAAPFHKNAIIKRSITSTSFVLPDPADAASSQRNNNNKLPALQLQHVSNLALTKIVATIGPTSEQAEPLLAVTAAGMRIMRLNFSHATAEEVQLRCTNLAAAQKHLSPSSSSSTDDDAAAASMLMPLQDTRAILLDTKGPEVRTGKLAHDDSGHETVHLVQGEFIKLQTSDDYKEASTAQDLYIDYANLAKAVQPGYKVLLDDGAIVLTVIETTTCNTTDNNNTVTCRIDNTGDLRSRAGVNLPLADTSDLPAMSAKDMADIKYGMEHADIDFVAASFVQTAQHVLDIRAYIDQCAQELGYSNKPRPLIISKIETAGALQHYDEILAESDGIMVARGDLGVEIPLCQVANAQKEMVAACNAVGKPVVVATQMLESMTKNPRPTRAEVSDVTNAVYDGADAVMLSGETAKGKYPAGAVQMMNEIIVSAERYAVAGALASRMMQHTTTVAVRDTAASSPDVAIAKAAVAAVSERDCAAILVLPNGNKMSSETNNNNNNNIPGLVASFRPAVPILAYCQDAKRGRQWQIHRGIHPVVMAPPASSSDDAVVDANQRAAHALKQAQEMGHLQTGDEVVIVALQEEAAVGHTASMKIATVP